MEYDQGHVYYKIELIREACRTWRGEFLLSPGYAASPCKRCIMSISINVPQECFTLWTLEGNVWKWGKAISDNLHLFSPVEWKYFSSKSISARVSLTFDAEIWRWSSFTLFWRGINFSIDSSTYWTPGLNTWGICKSSYKDLEDNEKNWNKKMKLLDDFRPSLDWDERQSYLCPHFACVYL